jgi:prepilin-type N-terminal cleavage/methylation domain-containing protein
VAQKIKIAIPDQCGFSLLEVLIATTIFAVFAAMYVSSQGGNLNDSIQMKEENKLKSLAQTILYETLNDPPPLNQSLTVTKTKKTFENDPNYEWEIEWERFTVPDLSRLQGQNEDQRENQTSFQKQILASIKQNLENIIWQIRVTARNKETGFFYSLSTWVYNHKARVQLGTLR